MNQGRIIVITGAPGTGKTTTASVVAKESDLEKSVHMHTDDFYHYLSIERSKLDRETNIELVETMWNQFSNLGIYELNVIDTTTHSIKDTVSAVKEKIVSGTALLF
jgi:uridine kinase